MLDQKAIVSLLDETAIVSLLDEAAIVSLLDEAAIVPHLIQVLLETNLGRLQVELYKELKKNGPSRSLRAALWRFADMCHLIRPQKCRYSEKVHRRVCYKIIQALFSVRKKT